MSVQKNDGSEPLFETHDSEEIEEMVGKKQKSKTKTSELSFFGKVYRIYYYYGARFLLYYKRVRRKARNTFRFAGKRLRKTFVKALNFAGKQVEQGLFNFLDIFRRANYRHQKSKARILKKRKSGIVTTLFLGFYIVRDVVKLVFRLALSLMNYVAPAAAIAFLVFTISFFSNVSYGLEVSLNGETLGYIRDEKIYQVAEKMMQGRIYYNEDEKALYTTPSFSLAVVSDKLFLEDNELCDMIILASAQDITQATGLYIDGKFFGATDQPEVLDRALESVKDRYRMGMENEIVEFVQDVQQQNGYYLISSIEPIEKLTTLVTGEEEGRQVYEVAEGDSPSLIAQKLDISTEELLNMNPGIEESLFIGDELLIKNSQPYLGVQSRAVVVENREIPFEKETIEDSSKLASSNPVILQTGKNGQAKVTAEVVYQNGVQVNKIVLEEEILEEPVTQRTSVGTKVYTSSGTVNVSYADVQSSGSMQWPVAGGGRITSGWMGYRGHTGTDIQSYAGDSILAADNGVVIYAAYTRYGYGNHVIVQHSNGLQTLYAHMSELAVSSGQTVSRGQVIGYEGRTGNATGVHLHFEVRVNGSAVNAAPYIQ